MAKSGGIFGCHTWGESMYLASGEEEPGMLLKIPTAQSHLIQNANSAELDKPCLT